MLPAMDQPSEHAAVQMADEALSAPGIDPTIDEAERAFYTRLADTWWDDTGPFWPLHKLNRLRTSWIRAHLLEAFGLPDGAAPLAGLSVLDIGCGGGLLSEAMAGLGATVTGIDVTEKNVAVASLHARSVGREITYRAVPASTLVAEGASFDIVLNMEVVEHVADVQTFMRDAGALARPGGVQFVATINRNPIAWLVAIIGAEYVLRWLPRGTHQYRKLVKPREVQAALADGGFEVTARTVWSVRVSGLTKTPVRAVTSKPPSASAA